MHTCVGNCQVSWTSPGHATVGLPTAVDDGRICGRGNGPDVLDCLGEQVNGEHTRCNTAPEVVVTRSRWSRGGAGRSYWRNAEVRIMRSAAVPRAE